MQGRIFPSIVQVVQRNAFHQFKHELFGVGGGRWKRGV
jgi:hypothetical protein